MGQMKENKTHQKIKKLTKNNKQTLTGQDNGKGYFYLLYIIYKIVYVRSLPT